MCSNQDLFDFSTDGPTWYFSLSAPSLEKMDFHAFQTKYTDSLLTAFNNKTKIMFWVDVSGLKDNLSIPLMLKFAYLIAHTRQWSQQAMERVVVLTGGGGSIVQNFVQILGTIVPLSSPMVICETKKTAVNVFTQSDSPPKRVQFVQ